MVYVAWVFTTQGREMFTERHGSERGSVVLEVERIARCECRWEDVESQVVGSGVVPGQWHWRAQQSIDGHYVKRAIYLVVNAQSSKKP